MKQLTIQEWFCRAVVAGLMQNEKNIWVEWNGITDSWWITNLDPNSLGWEIDYATSIFSNNLNRGMCGVWIQLRSNGKDIYSLEWRKPNEQDVGKMCWFMTKACDIKKQGLLTKVTGQIGVSAIRYALGYTNYMYCLLADHGQIAPTEQDFKRIYGE